MKNFKKLITLLLSTLMMITIISGCGEKVAPPEEFAKGAYDLVVYGQSDTLKALFINDEDAESLKTTYEKRSKDETKNNLNLAGISFTDEDIDNIYNAALNLRKKATCTIETVSSDKETAFIKIKTTHINSVALDEDAANEAIQEIQNMGLSDREMLLNKAGKLYIQKVIDKLNNGEPSSDTLEKSFSFKKVKDVKTNKDIWIPENPVTFGNDLMTMITK